MYADNQGNIGYVGAGQIPIRNKGNGELPVPGWQEQYHWRGFVPPSQWPAVFNPSEGYIVSANNKVVSDEYPYFISQDWAPPARAARITQLIEHKRSIKTLTTDDMRDIQADTLSLPAQQLLPLITAVKPLNSRQQQAIDMLSNWDGDMQKDSPAAALFAMWSRQLRQAMFDDELAGQWGKIAEQGFLLGLSGQVTADNVAEILINAKSNGALSWCDNISTTSVESCDTILLQSLDETLTQLSKLAGSDLDDWHWGEIHYTTYDHQPFSNIKLFDSIFERKVINGGGSNTVNVSGAQFDKSIGYQQTFGAVFRQIITMGNGTDGSQTNTHLVMNSTGQSGNVLSEHYSNMVIPFRDVNFVSMDAVEQQTTVLLTPVSSAAESKAKSQP